MQSVRWHLAPIIVLIAALVPLIAALPLSYWLADEFHTGRQFAEAGIGNYWERVFEWSPRPFSEFVLYLYMSAVNALGRPMIGEFVGLHWLLAGSGIALAGSLAPKRDRPAVLILGLALLVVPAFGPRSSEVYFWAQAVLAYMPTFVALILATLAVVSLDLTRNSTWVWVHALLAFAALCSEVGAMVALCAAPILALGAVIRRSPELTFKIGISALVVLAATTVFYGLINGRIAEGAELFGDASIAGHLLPAAASASIRLTAEALSVSPNVTRGSWLGAGLLIKALFAVSVFCAAPGPDGSKAAIYPAAFGLAFLFAAWGSIFGGYFQFGLVCCDRHGVFRYLALILATVCFAKAAAAILRPRLTIRPALGPLSLAAAVALPLGFGLPMLAADLRRVDEITSVRARNWANARLGGDKLDWLVVRPGRAVTGTSPSLVPGYFAGDHVPGGNRFVMEYFGKIQIDVRWIDPEGP